MNQVKQIYLKDLRHHWPYAVASIVLLADFARNDVRSWWQPTGAMDYGIGAASGLFSSGFLAGVATSLIPITWALLIVLAVQTDSLVGDRQFWVTRPYEWKSVLVAKMLFVLTVINTPLLIVDIFLLAKAGFAPTHYIVGLLWMQGLMTLVLVLPCLTLATLTRTVPQMLLAVAAVVLFFIGLIWLSSEIPNSGVYGVFESIQEILFGAACVAVILIQYARRWTQPSRTIILGLACATLLLMIVTPRRGIGSQEFPPLHAGEQPAFQLTPIHPKGIGSQSWPSNQEEVPMNLPFSVSGVAAKSILRVEGIVVQIEAAGRPSWSSGWTDSNTSMFPDTSTIYFGFSIKQRLLNQMQSSPAKLKLTVAFTTYNNSNETDFVIPPEAFYIQDLGPCLPGKRFFRQVHCLAPLHGPRSLFLTADLSRSTCPLQKEELQYPEGTLGHAWSTSDSGPAEFGLSPVKEIDLGISILPNMDSRRGAGLCPGTPVIVSNPVPVRSNQMSIELDNIRLSDFQLYRFDSDADVTVTTAGRN